ncbi:MAG: hypothetical protein ACTHK2_03255 [Dokdonella sp.]|uniref:hypothetical protein n=1 Tax=Dokdonella sp. TaxID=2291710 RepID=UPI003F7D29CA
MLDADGTAEREAGKVASEREHRIRRFGGLIDLKEPGGVVAGISTSLAMLGAFTANGFGQREEILTSNHQHVRGAPSTPFALVAAGSDAHRWRPRSLRATLARL